MKLDTKATIHLRGGIFGDRRSSALSTAVTCAFAAALALSMVPCASATAFAAEGGAAITLTYGSDANGSVTEWMLKGDADRSGDVTEVDADLIAKHATDFSEIAGELALESADVDGNKSVRTDDAHLVRQVVGGSESLPASGFTFRVIDTANPGYRVSRITVNGAELTIPKVLFTSEGKVDTTVNGVTYTVLTLRNATTVTGSSLATNDVQFEHVPQVPGAALTYGTDGLGSVTEWMLSGDADRDAQVTNSDGEAIQNHEVGLAPLTDPLALEAADVNKDGFEDAGDASAIYRLVAGAETLPFAEFDFRVIDVPNAGHEVSGITVNGSPLVVPAKGQSADTQANGSSYTVKVAADGTATVTGLSLATNDVQFTHAAIMVDVPFAGPDTNGDGNPDDTVTPAPMGSKIKVDPAGGLWMGSANAQDVVVTDPMGRIADPTRDGYTFKGWEKGAATGYAFMLTATWAAIPTDDGSATEPKDPSNPSNESDSKGNGEAKVMPMTGDTTAPFALAGFALAAGAATSLVLARRRMVR